MKKLIIIILAIFSLNLSGQTSQDKKHIWGDIDYIGAPWTFNISKPNKISKGLLKRHIALWASHGCFYDNDRKTWRWQRPNLFCTTEDLFTQTIVVPYLIPMLENAGCNVFTPRERDWQRNEVIVDNDGIWPGGMIIKELRTELEETVGFKMHSGHYIDKENPFTYGTALVMKTVKGRNATRISYVPEIKESGRYAVYVSYPRLDDAVEDVTYLVRHKNIETTIQVNQKMGYGTWVYIGTYDFGQGSDEANSVTILNTSHKKGHIGTDAIRFGGGMGNFERGGSVSGLPRFLEGARYSTQWAGASYDIYSTKDGVNDYGDDINARSLMENWLGGCSCYMPNTEGLQVPIELSVAVHSDAGYNPDGQSIHGSLAIATTDFNDGLLDAGISRQTSLYFAEQLRDNLFTDMEHQFGQWGKRYLWDRNYSETRLPAVPSAIIETLSHQSFPDMKIGQHPMGKFFIARSLYKTIARYICEQHDKDCVIAPLSPKDFHVDLLGNNKVKLSWIGVIEDSEPSSKPESYNIYTAIGDNDFDNGQNINSTSVLMNLIPDQLYRFKITACNDGGESFPTETLTAYISSREKARIIVVDGFERLSAPYIIDNDSLQGFDLTLDEGVQRGSYPGWSGYQKVFTKSTMGQEDENGLGYSGNELEGKIIAGNNFDSAVEHTLAIVSSGQYSVASTSLSALNDEIVNLKNYNAVDIAFGLQKDDGQLGYHYKTFTSSIKRQLTDYLLQGKSLVTSGSFVGSDNMSDDDAGFVNDILKCNYQGAKTEMNGTIKGLGMEYEIYNSLNEKHFAATHPESLSPNNEAICAMQYEDGTSAAVGYKGQYSTFTIGFPIECIKDNTTKNKIMQGILAYVLNK